VVLLMMMLAGADPTSPVVEEVVEVPPSHPPLVKVQEVVGHPSLALTTGRPPT